MANDRQSKTLEPFVCPASKLAELYALFIWEGRLFIGCGVGLSLRPIAMSLLRLWAAPPGVTGWYQLGIGGGARSKFLSIYMAGLKVAERICQAG